MKKFKYLLVIFLYLVVSSHFIHAEFFIGLEGGGAFPLNNLKNYFSGNFQGGLCFEISTEIPFLSIYAKARHYSFNDNIQTIYFIPLTLGITAKLPWKYLFKPYLTCGGGITWEKLKNNKQTIENIDPVFSAGAGIQYLFKKGKWVFIPYIEGLYDVIYQKSLKEAKHNGEIFLMHAGVKLQI